jgi:hypothetical protein
VYLAGFGWIPFEPTPGRGIPGSEGYTGVPEAQASPGDPSTATTLATTTTVTTPTNGASTTVTLPDVGDASSGGRSSSDAESRWLRVLVGLAVLLVLPLLWLGGVTAARVIRRRQRRARASTAGARIDVAWTEVGEALARAGVPARRSETPSEYARRAARAADLDPRLLDGLAGLTTVARYAPPGEDELDDETLEQAVAVARDIEETLDQRLDRRTRIRDAFDPRVPAGR